MAERVPFVFGCFATLDPASGLIGRTYKTRSLGVGDEEFAALEYGAPDINRFAEIAGNASLLSASCQSIPPASRSGAGGTVTSSSPGSVSPMSCG